MGFETGEQTASTELPIPAWTRDLGVESIHPNVEGLLRQDLEQYGDRAITQAALKRAIDQVNARETGSTLDPIHAAESIDATEGKFRIVVIEADDNRRRIWHADSPDATTTEALPVRAGERTLVGTVVPRGAEPGTVSRQNVEYRSIPNAGEVPVHYQLSRQADGIRVRPVIGQDESGNHLDPRYDIGHMDQLLAAFLDLPPATTLELSQATCTLDGILCFEADALGLAIDRVLPEGGLWDAEVLSTASTRAQAMMRSAGVKFEETDILEHLQGRVTAAAEAWKDSALALLG